MVPRKEIFGWAMFDVANSAFTTIIITVAYNNIFSKLIVGPMDGHANPYATGNFYWSAIVAISSLITMLLSPTLGTLSDVMGRRKQFLAGSVALCCLFTGALYFAQPGHIATTALFVVVGNLGFLMSENFIAAFLPHISTAANIGKISGIAWGLGYFGGLGSILLVSAVTGLEYTPENMEKLRLVGPLTAAFFLAFSIPTFLFVSEPKRALGHSASLKEAIKTSFQELLGTFKHLERYRDLARFLTAFFFFQGGLTIVISFAALYGEQVVHVDGKWQAIFFITLQITAAVGAFAFGYLQSRIGALRTVNITLLIWILAILLIYFLEDMAVMTGMDIKPLFVVVGNVAGLCLGATQASARSVVGLFAPAERSGEFFGFWGVAGKAAAVASMLSFGLLQYLFTLPIALLACSAFFVVGFAINCTVNEARGRASASPS
jgi:MFS transporter, UMF1 family